MYDSAVPVPERGGIEVTVYKSQYMYIDLPRPAARRHDSRF